MTNEHYDEAKMILTNADICSFAERICSRSGIDPIVDYPRRADSHVMPSAARRQMYLGRSIDLIRRMIFLGATYFEILRAAEYMLVIMKSLECALDYRRCESELEISELEQKYSRTEFLTTNLSPLDMKLIVKRDNGYYPEPIIDELAGTKEDISQ